MAALNNLYERDFYAWAERNVQLLRDRNFAEADVVNIAREIEDMGISQRRELGSHLRQLLEHLLKIAYVPRPEACNHLQGWQEIRNHRREIADLLERMPSLQRFLDQELAGAFEKAREDFLAEYVVPTELISARCPFQKDNVLDLQFVPEYLLG
jgi:hypothetical protein